MDRNREAFLKHQLAKMDNMRVAALQQFIAVLLEHHGGQCRINARQLAAITQGVFSVRPSQKDDLVTFTVFDDKAGKPLVTPLPAGVPAKLMADAVCSQSPDGICAVDADTLAELFEAYYQNCKRAEAEARTPEIATPAPEPEPPIERCQECFLAFGEHRESCSQKVALRKVALRKVALRKVAAAEAVI